MKEQPKVSEIVIMASGAVMLLFSFFAWFGEDDFKITAWSGDFGSSPFPLFTYAPIFGAILAGVTAARVFGGLNLPANIIGFSWPQIVRALAIFSLLLTIGIWITGEDAKIGLILNILGSVGLVVGSFLSDNESSAAPSAGTPPTPF